MKEPTSQQIQQRIEKFFTADAELKWDDKAKCYILKPAMIIDPYDGKEIPHPGTKAWIKRYKGIRMDKIGMLVPASLLEGILQSLGKCGLCYSIEGGPDE